MQWQIKSTGPDDTQRIGQELGKLLKAPAVIELRSDLGGGKTTFVRGLIRGLGADDKVVSPTFTLNRIYRTPRAEIHHFDFYRLNQPGLVSEQLTESLQNPEVITLIEWSDIVRGVLPKERLTIELLPAAEDLERRLISISYPESKTNLVKKLQTELMEIEP